MMLDVHKVAQIIDHNTGLSSPDGDNSFVRVGMIKTGKTFDGHIEKSGSFLTDTSLLWSCTHPKPELICAIVIPPTMHGVFKCTTLTYFYQNL